MGRRKPFIDKKHATTYSLVCKEGPQVQPGGPRDLLDDPAFASAYLDTKRNVARDLPESKRKEILELGLPDDGYDYLQHVRDPATERVHYDGEEGDSANGERASCTHHCAAATLSMCHWSEIPARALCRAKGVPARALLGAAA
jgi:hypothetical protein